MLSVPTASGLTALAYGLCAQVFCRIQVKTRRKRFRVRPSSYIRLKKPRLNCFRTNFLCRAGLGDILSFCLVRLDQRTNERNLQHPTTTWSRLSFQC